MTTFVRGEDAVEAAGGLDTVHAGHDQVHQRDVGRVLGGELHGLLPAPGLGDHGYVRLGLQERPHALAHQRVVVYQQDRYGFAHDVFPLFDGSDERADGRDPACPCPARSRR